MKISEEGRKYLKKYILGKEIFHPANASFDYGILFQIFKNIKSFNRPDFYSIVGNTLYLIEHFEIDSTKHTRKGSKNKIEEFNDEQKFQKTLESKEDDSAVVHYGQIKAEPKIQYYLESLFNAFKKHYSKIGSYKQHLKEKGICTDEYEIKTIFIIEDTSIFGTLYFNNGTKLLLPIFGKEFTKYFGSIVDVELVICSSETTNDKTITWALDKNDISLMDAYQVKFSDIELINLNPMTIREGLFIPY